MILNFFWHNHQRRLLCMTTKKCLKLSYLSFLHRPSTNIPLYMKQRGQSLQHSSLNRPACDKRSERYSVELTATIHFWKETTQVKVMELPQKILYQYTTMLFITFNFWNALKFGGWIYLMMEACVKNPWRRREQLCTIKVLEYEQTSNAPNIIVGILLPLGKDDSNIY